MSQLDAPMTGDGCRSILFTDEWHEPLKAACAEDSEIWEIYANNFGPDGFDDSIALYQSTPRNRTFVLFEGDELAGMSSYLGIDEGRGVLEIGGTYYRPKFRDRFQPPGQGYDASPRVRLRFPPDRVPRG